MGDSARKAVYATGGSRRQYLLAPYKQEVARSSRAPPILAATLRRGTAASTPDRCCLSRKATASPPWGVARAFRPKQRRDQPRRRLPLAEGKRAPVIPPFRAKEGPAGAGGGARRRTKAGPPGAAGSSWEEKEKSRTTLPGWLRVLPVRACRSLGGCVTSTACSGPPVRPAEHAGRGSAPRSSRIQETFLTSAVRWRELKGRSPG